MPVLEVICRLILHWAASEEVGILLIKKLKRWVSIP